MPKYQLPRQYAEAVAKVQEQSAKGKSVKLFDGILLNGDGTGPIAIVADGEQLVTFRPDGSIKICTRGRNTFANISRINACLPKQYRISKKECHLRLRLNGRTLATFLASTVFTPGEPVIACDDFVGDTTTEATL